jgi:hypothetical protein
MNGLSANCIQLFWGGIIILPFHFFQNLQKNSEKNTPKYTKVKK